MRRLSGRRSSSTGRTSSTARCCHVTLAAGAHARPVRRGCAAAYRTRQLRAQLLCRRTAPLRLSPRQRAPARGERGAPVRDPARGPGGAPPRPSARRAPAVAAAALGAGLWLVHPVQTQAVSYVYQRFTVLCVFFYLASIAAWIASRRSHGGTKAGLQLLCVSLGLLALGTKEIARDPAARASPPPRRRLPRPALRARVDPSGRLARRARRGRDARDRAAVFLGSDFVAMMADDYARRGFTLGQRLLTESRVVVHYQTLLVAPLPSRLTLDYDVPLSTGIVEPPATLASILLLPRGRRARARAGEAVAPVLLRDALVGAPPRHRVELRAARFSPTSTACTSPA